MVLGWLKVMVDKILQTYIFTNLILIVMFFVIASIKIFDFIYFFILVIVSELYNFKIYRDSKKIEGV